MKHTVIGLFDTTADAQNVVRDLVNSGVASDAISVMTNTSGGAYTAAMADTSGASDAGEGAAVGAIGGGVLGGALGLLVGVGALVIPGIGPVLAAGPLAAALGAAGASAAVGAGVGAASGGLLGALMNMGVPEEHAHVYAEGLRRGGTLVSVTTDDVPDTTIVDIMRRHNAVDLQERREEWQQSGWHRFDPENSPPLT